MSSKKSNKCSDFIEIAEVGDVKMAKKDGYSKKGER